MREVLRRYAYLLAALASFLACALLYFAVLLYQADWGQRPVDYLQGLYSLKDAAAERAIATNTPKLVLVSGSNSHYGIRCATIIERTGIYCVNGGIHAGIGIDYLLDRARDWLRPGDIALMPLEFNHYLDRGIPSKFFIHYLLRYDRGYINRRGPIDRLRFWFGLPLSRLWKHATDKFFGRVAPDSGPDYAEEVGTYGDRLRNEARDRTEIQKGYIDDAEPRSVLMTQTLVRASPGARSIRRFIRWCRKHDVTPIATWPNAMWFEAYTEENPQEFFAAIEQFYAELNVPMVGRPEQMMYGDRALFFDSDYHLNRVGVDRHTDLAIELLDPYLSDLQPATDRSRQPFPKNP